MARQIKMLTEDEQAHLRALLETVSIPTETAVEAQRATLEHLLAKGIIAHTPDRCQKGYRPEPHFESFTPVPMIGRPLSETLLEDWGPH